MLSRVADTIYWMARYMERTQGMLQVLRTNYIASQDEINEFSWRAMLYVYGSEMSSDEVVTIERNTSKVFEYLITDKTNVSSVYNNIERSRENARAIQDHITKEVWQCLNQYYHYLKEPEVEEQLTNGDRVTAFDLLLKHALLFTGTVKNTMTRDEAYNYLHLGKFLERAISTTDILRMKLSEISQEPVHPLQSKSLRYLLYSLLGYEIYMKTYKGYYSKDHVIELTIQNQFFPHSIVYSLYQLNKYFERLKPESLIENYEQLEFMLGKIFNQVKYGILKPDNEDELDQFLLNIRSGLIDIGNAFNKYYFGNT